MIPQSKRSKTPIFLYRVALAIFCLVLSACGSSGGGKPASFPTFNANGIPQDYAGGPLSPVGGGSGIPTSFGPQVPGPEPSPGPGPDNIIAVIYATDESGISSFNVAPDGVLSVRERGLISPQGFTRLFLDPTRNLLHATNARTQGENFYTYSIDPVTKLLSQLGPPIDVGGYPSDFTFLKNTAFAYATNRNAGGFFGVNTVTSLMSQTDGQLVPNPNSPTVSTGDFPNQVIIDGTGTWMYVSNNAGSISIYRINADGSLTPQTGLPGMDGGLFSLDGTPTGMLLSRDARYLYLSIDGDGIDVVTTYALGSDGSLSALGSTPIANPGVLREHPTLPILYVASGSNLLTLDVDEEGQTSLKPGTSPLAIGSYPGPILLEPSQNYVYVFSYFDNFISCFRSDANTGVLTPMANFEGVSSIAGAVIIPAPGP